jgi:synaptobrevin family protein YKT6
MRLTSIYIGKLVGNVLEEIFFQEDLRPFSFFQRSVLKESLRFCSSLIAQRTPKGQRQMVLPEDERFKFACYTRTDQISVVITTNKDYPERVAFDLIKKVLQVLEEENHETKLKDLFSAYLEPSEFDKLLRVQQTLDDVKNVMHKNIEELLERGERLDDLVIKSTKLSDTSKLFYKQAKKQNQCCKSW